MELRCPECHSTSYSQIDSIASHTYYRCDSCKTEFVSIEDKSPKWVITREDNNKLLTSEKQAIKVAEKLALENPNFTYYICKIMFKSKAVSAITTKIE